MVIHLAYLIYYLASITALVILDNSSLNPSVLLQKPFSMGWRMSLHPHSSVHNIVIIFDGFYLVT